MPKVGGGMLVLLQVTISNNLNTNNARLIDIDYDEASDAYNVIMVSCSTGCPNWWWYYGIPLSNVISTIEQDGARAIDFNPVPCGPNTCFAMVLINNSNAETTRVGEMLRSNTDGTVGLYLKQVGGPVLASLMDTTTFEPASTIKASYTSLYTPASCCRGCDPRARISRNIFHQPVEAALATHPMAPNRSVQLIRK